MWTCLAQPQINPNKDQLMFSRPSLVKLFSIALLVVSTATVSYAMMSIDVVTTKEARSIGIDVRAKPNGPKHVWVELEFNTEGTLKDFQHVSMEIREDDELLVGYAPMKAERQDSGTVKCTFMANRKYLDKITLSIVTAKIPHGLGDMVGHEIQLKEFIDITKLPK